MIYVEGAKVAKVRGCRWSARKAGIVTRKFPWRKILLAVQTQWHMLKTIAMSAELLATRVTILS